MSLQYPRKWGYGADMVHRLHSEDWNALLDMINKIPANTAEVGTDISYQYADNYFYCDGVADEVTAQAAITYLEGIGGGRLHFDRSQFHWAGGVTHKTAVPIIFEGEGLCHNASPDTGTLIDFDGAAGDTVIDCDSGAFADNQMLVMRDLSILVEAGKTKATIGLNINRVNRVYTENVYIYASGGSADGGYGIVSGAQGNNGMQLVNTYAGGFQENFYLFTDHALLSKCQALYGLHGFNIIVAGADVKLDNCHAYNQTAAGAGFRVNYPAFFGQCKIDNCYSENPATFATTDLDLDATVGSIIVDHFRSSIEPPRVTVAGTHYRLRGPYFDACGWDTGTGAEQEVVHGLSLAPGYVSLTEYNTGGALAYESNPASTAHLHVTATAAKTFRWYAECRGE